MDSQIIINLMNDPNFFSCVLFGFCCPAFFWFLGFSIKGVISLLKNIKSVT